MSDVSSAPMGTAVATQAQAHTQRFSLAAAGTYAASSIFFLFLLMSQLILDIFVYEFGHGISSALAAGWHNNLSIEGETFYTDPSYFRWLHDYLATQGVTVQEYLNNQLPASFNSNAFIQAAFHQQPGIFWGFAGAFLIQGALALALFAYSRTPLFHTVGPTGRLFLSSFVVVSLADLSMRLVNAFTDGPGDDLWVLREGVLGGNWLALVGFVLLGIGLAALAVHIGRTQLAESLRLLTGAPAAAAERAGLAFAIGLLAVNFGVRLDPLAQFLPGLLYSIVFLVLFLGTAIYSGAVLVRGARRDGAAISIPGHLLVSYGLLLAFLIFCILQQVGIVTGADPGAISGNGNP